MAGYNNRYYHTYYFDLNSEKGMMFKHWNLLIFFSLSDNAVISSFAKKYRIPYPVKTIRSKIFNERKKFSN